MNTEILFYQCDCCLNIGVTYKAIKHCSYCGTLIDREEARKNTYKIEEELNRRNSE